MLATQDTFPASFHHSPACELGVSNEQGCVVLQVTARRSLSEVMKVF